MLWVVGGVLALCGALCYAELATALPASGGEYNFLSRIYHPMVGFCTGLCSATIGFAAPIAVSALVFGQYLCRAFPGHRAVVPNNTEHAAAFLLVILVTAAHLRSLRFTGAFQAAATGDDRAAHPRFRHLRLQRHAGPAGHLSAPRRGLEPVARAPRSSPRSSG